MLKTEEEARRCWCPLGRQYEWTQGPQMTAFGQTSPTYAVSPGFNRKANGDVPACLASTCMAWRWGEPKILREIDPVTSDVVDEQPRRGYCGAFGKPIEEE